MLDLLDHVQAGYFDTVFILPSTSTWFRQTQAGAFPQSRVRSRSQPLGLDSLDQLGRTVAEQSNKQLEFCSWVAEQPLNCSTASLILIIPEDSGEHRMEDPPSPWCFREFMKLDSLHEAKRGSAFGCQLFSADRSTALGILSDIPEIGEKLALGWPRSPQSGIPWFTQALIPAGVRVRFRTQLTNHHFFGSSWSLQQPLTPSPGPSGTGQWHPVLSLLHSLRR